MNSFHAAMSIKPESDPHLNEYIFSFTGVEIVSVISSTEHIQKQSVKGIPGIHCKSISTFDLQKTQACCSVPAELSLFYGKKGSSVLQFSGIFNSTNSKEVFQHDDKILLYTKPLTHIMKPLTKPLLKKNCSVQC